MYSTPVTPVILKLAIVWFAVTDVVVTLPKVIALLPTITDVFALNVGATMLPLKLAVLPLIRFVTLILFALAILPCTTKSFAKLP